MSDREVIMRFPPEKPKPGYPCPRCHGQGNMGDGSTSWAKLEDGSTEYRYRAPTKCSLCEGKARVHCTPISDDEM